MRKLFSILFTIALTFTSLWALPGFQSYIPDKPGEYVYYKDNTFLRESYMGLLYYDNSVVQARYYAPADKKQKLPEEEINILISINPDASHWEMTGENILSTIVPNTDDTTLVNYLHDVLYEFSAHRIKTEEVNTRDKTVTQDFSQFGGNVKITYDCTIPMFNIREIKNFDDEVLLQCITTGQISSNSDHSFNNFKGFPDDNYKKGWKKYSKAKAQDYEFENQKITLDKNWEQKMDNMWTLKDDSFLSLSQLPPVNADVIKTENFLIRHFSKSSQGTYSRRQTLEINKTDNSLKFSIESYNPENQKTVVNTFIISPKKDSENMDFLSLATYKQPWLNNKKYYENILKSYKN